MAELPPDDEMVTALRKELTECQAFDGTAIAREVKSRDLPQGLSLTAILRDALGCLDLCHAIARYPDEAFHGIPNRAGHTAADAARGVAGLMRAISAFRLTGSSNDQQTYARITTGSVATDLPIWFQQLAATLSYLRRNDGADTDGALARLGEVTNETNALKGEVRALVTEAKSALKAAKQTALQKGVAEQGEEFRNAITVYSDEATLWEKRAIVCAAVILAVVSYAILFGSGPPLKTESWMLGANLSYFSARALFISVWSFAMVICVRNYRGAKHNQIMNAHRARALATFQKFTKGADATVTQAVTLHAAESVFSMQPTGFGDHGTIGSTHIAETLAAVTDKK